MQLEEDGQDVRVEPRAVEGRQGSSKGIHQRHASL